jgi:branched-subunit amino acid transport protein AzlD
MMMMMMVVVVVVVVMMMMMRCLPWSRFRAKPRHLPYIYIYV